MKSNKLALTLGPALACASLFATQSAFAQDKPQDKAHADDPAYSPKAAADPAPIPAPNTPTGPTGNAANAAKPDAPMSTSGAALLSPSTASSSGGALVPADAAHEASQDAREGSLKSRLDAAEKKIADLEEHFSWWKNLHITGYVQPQILIQSFNTAASPNLVNGVLPVGVGANDVIATSSGTSTNGTYFRMRRARLKTEYMPSDFAKLVFEFDPNLSGAAVAGTGTIARQIEAMGIAHYTPDLTEEFSAGIFKLPFGFEVPQLDADRPFIERSWGEQNMFPSEFDTGARTKVIAFDSKLQVHAAVVNGVTIGEKNFSVVPDLNHGKDVVGRMNYDFGPIDAGISGYVGTGQNIDATDLRFKQFGRWAANLEIGVHHTFLPKVGKTKLFAEITVAENMDRGLHYTFAVPQIPANITQNAQCGGVADAACDERSIFIRLEQDITEWVTAGIRWDEYTPDISQGQNARDTLSVVGVVHFTRGLQLMAEYDFAEDNIHARGGQAAGKQLNTGSGVLQARF